MYYELYICANDSLSEHRVNTIYYIKSTHSFSGRLQIAIHDNMCSK